MPRKISTKVCYRRTNYLIVKLVFYFCRYAFVLHRTFRDAEHNLQRPIDYDLLGPKCRIEYANGYSAPFHNHYNFDNKTLVVSRIPGNVSENDLHRLFAGCRTVKYCPARNIHLSTTMMETKNKNRTLLGYEQLVL